MQQDSSQILRFFNLVITITLISGQFPEGDPGDIRGNSAGFAGFCYQCLARDWGIGQLLHFRSKIHGGRPAGFVTLAAILKMKDPDHGKGFQNGNGENKKL